MVLNTLKSIFYRPDFFREQHFTGGASFRFYSLTLLLVVGVTVLTLLPGFFHVVNSIRSGEWHRQQVIIERLYPAGLELTVDQNTLSTNQSAPVVIVFPDEWRESACSDGHQCHDAELPTNLVVIDTDAPVTPQMMADRDTLILMGEREVGVHNPDRGETRIFDLRETNFSEHLTITKTLYDRWVGMGSDFLRTLFYIGAALIPFIMYIGLWIGYLIYSLFGALVVWLAGHFRGQSLTYGRAYLSALCLLPAPFVMSFLMQWTGTHIPLAFTLVLFIAALVNFPKVEVLPAPIKIATADTPVVPKEAEVESTREDSRESNEEKLVESNGK